MIKYIIILLLIGCAKQGVEKQRAEIKSCREYAISRAIEEGRFLKPTFIVTDGYVLTSIGNSFIIQKGIPGYNIQIFGSSGEIPIIHTSR